MKNAKLLDAKSTATVGDPQSTTVYKSYIFEVSGTATSFNVRIEAVGPSGTAYALRVWDELNNVFVGTDVATKGIYSVSVPILMQIRANLTAVSGGNITVDGGLGQ